MVITFIPKHSHSMNNNTLDEYTVLEILEKFKPELKRLGDAGWQVYVQNKDTYTFKETNEKRYFQSLTELALFMQMENLGLTTRTLIEKVKDTITNYSLAYLDSEPQTRQMKAIEIVANTRKLRNELAEELKHTHDDFVKRELQFWHSKIAKHLVDLQMREIGVIVP